MSVIAYRFWRIVDSDGILRPSTLPRTDPRFATWVDDVAHAGECTVPVNPPGHPWARPRYRPHGSPISDCECGLYAFTEPNRMLREFDVARRFRQSSDWVPPPPGARWVSGVVELWGHAIRHEHGYRIAHARIRAICDPNRLVGDTYTAARYTTPEPMLAEWHAPADEEEQT